MNFTVTRGFFFHQKYIQVFIFLCLFVSACGYRFAGSGNLPEGIQTIAVEVLENRTSETGLGNTITNALIFEFIRKGRSVQRKSKNAEAVLTGVIKSLRIATISRQAQQSPLERRVKITVSLKLTGSNDRVVWSGSRISEFEEYKVGTNKSATENNKNRAIQTLSKRLAEKVYNRLTDNF